MKKLSAFLLLGLSLLLTTCTQSPERKPPNQIGSLENFLKVNLADDPDSIDPRIVRSIKDLTLAKQLFEGLTRLDCEGKPVLAIAETVNISKDLKTYTFKLRASIWTNGDKVTAHDFIYAWSKVVDPAFRTDYSHMLYPIKNARLIREGKCPVDALGVLALDDRTLVVQLEEAIPYFLELTAFPTFFPVRRGIDEQQPKWSSKAEYFVGNGPFVLDSWKSRDELKLVKNTNYWDKDNVRLNGIIFSMITDNNTEAELYQKNELDWLGLPISHSISTDLLQHLKSQGKVSSYKVAGTFWFAFNTQKAPFDDVRIRKAFSFAINRADIIEHVLQGNQTVATSPVPECLSNRKEACFIDGDVIEAQKLLECYLADKQISKEQFPEVVLYHTPQERNAKIAQAVQQQWQKAFEIPIKMESVEGKYFRSQIRLGNFSIATSQWVADFNDPIAFLEIFKYHKSEANGLGMNETNWQNDQFIALLDQSKTAPDASSRIELLESAERLLVNEMPIAPLYHYSWDYLKKDYVKNVVLSPLGLADFKEAEIEVSYCR